MHTTLTLLLRPFLQLKMWILELEQHEIIAKLRIALIEDVIALHEMHMDALISDGAHYEV